MAKADTLHRNSTGQTNNTIHAVKCDDTQSEFRGYIIVKHLPHIVSARARMMSAVKSLTVSYMVPTL